jgi:T5SS/PEP-CTERM-associated repeat protein
VKQRVFVVRGFYPFLFAIYYRGGAKMNRFLENKMLMLLLMCAVLFFSCPSSKAPAAIVSSGDVIPADPTTWTSSTIGYIGKSSVGTITIDGGSGLLSNICCMGYNSGSTGTVTVTGTGSKWTNRSNIFVGCYGIGILNIEAGGQVNSTWASLGALPHYPSNSYSTGTVKVTGSASTWTCSNIIVGEYGIGKIEIEAGAHVNSTGGGLGKNSDSIGSVTVVGTDSKWTIDQRFGIGGDGKGILNIAAGGQVIDTYGYLGDYGSGTATVTGIGSKWTNYGDIFIGNGNNTLNITDGGAVTARSVPIGRQTLLAIDVGTGSKLICNESFTNDGKARILAGASPTENTSYSPISAGRWSGTGVYQAVGGTWDTTNHQFTVSGVQAGDSRVGVTIDRLGTQRVLIGGNASPWTLGASFAATATSAPLTFTATAISDGPLDALRGMMNASDALLGGWVLSAPSGYTAGDPIYLSFADGSGGYADENMQAWSYNGTTWSKLAAADLNYDGTYANFTATALGCYAVTAPTPVPEPGMAVLLTFGLMGLAAVGWRKRRR